MIYIETDCEDIPDGWIEKSDRLTDDLFNASSQEERKEVIDNNRQHWKDVKNILLEFSNKKCWYSEARDIASYYHVDHFRPKKKAKDIEGNEREGYWWLAFEWENYRIAGGVCNCKKRSKFPVHENSIMATSPDDNLEDEVIYLLDPTDPNDPTLISFDETGNPTPTTTKDTWEARRVEVTVDVFNLDFDRLVEERRKVWKRCSMKVNKAQEIMSRAPGIRRQADLENVMRDLRSMVSPEAELAGTARACLLKSGIEWAQRIAQNAREEPTAIF